MRSRSTENSYTKSCSLLTKTHPGTPPGTPSTEGASNSTPPCAPVPLIPSSPLLMKYDPHDDRPQRQPPSDTGPFVAQPGELKLADDFQDPRLEDPVNDGQWKENISTSEPSVVPLTSSEARKGKIQDTKIPKQDKVSATSRGDYFRFCDMWKYTTQRLVGSVKLLGFLKENTSSACFEETAQALGLKTEFEDSAGSFGLPLEDYLHGILNVPSLLVRYVITSVTSGHFEVPQLVLRYLLSLDTGFRLLPLKNDS
ncbi:unnamed protein product [Cyprideis torosa]|uniref:Uncharacterized protein n=1 Tax=Cyprideis torosa TaxID=163714 RepID=A0A7R8WKL0_9CRUS|nr:unnamed protein product [Cyprideis torosa]CAG0897006.1 unnamed protein product [Cyprideis torosa]